MIEDWLSDRFYDIYHWLNDNFVWDIWGGYNPITNPWNFITDILDRLGSFVIYGEVPKN